MSKKNMFLLIVFMFFFCAKPTVFAAQYDADVNSTYHGIEGCQEHWHYCWRTTAATSEFQGIRVTAYREDGVRISDSVDFTNSNADKAKANTHQYYLAANRNNKSRIDYISSGGNLSRVVGTPNVKYGDFQSFIQNTSNFSDVIQISDEDSIKRDINYCTGSYESKCSTGGAHYFVVEPVTIIWSRFEDYNYYGTYYELSYLIEHTGYPFQGGNGVSPFLPGNIALNLYISNTTGTFSSFYNRVGLHPLTSTQVSTTSANINSYQHEAVKNETVGASNVGKGYGIGVIKVSDVPEIEINEELEDCEVLTPKVDPCNNKIEYEYKNCPTSGLSSVTYTVKGSVKKVAEVQCNEKYYVATWKVRDAFKSMDGNGILAGTYVPLEAPTVWHKKSCRFARVSDAQIDSWARKQNTHPESYSCPTEDNPDKTCCCVQVLDVEGYQADLESIHNRLDNLKDNFDDLDSVSLANADSVGNVTLNVFSTYTLTPTKKIPVQTEVDGYPVEYKNEFNYSILGNINELISIEQVYDANKAGVTDADKVVKNPAPSITTPITIKEGTYNYTVNYSSIFPTSFKNVIKSNSSYDIDSALSSVSCSYKVKQRKIEKYCNPNVSNCGDPDESFPFPKIKMVYRPIDLTSPFPGKDGNSREAGDNWLADDNYIDKYITNNRGVNAGNLYLEKEPLYVINLNPKTIREIREYNKTTDYDDFTLSCTENAGTECLSNFLRDYNLITSGTCNTEDRTEFYTCLN